MSNITALIQLDLQTFVSMLSDLNADDRLKQEPTSNCFPMKSIG
jgi:hypothetical protein